MKRVFTKTILLSAAFAFCASTLQAGWVMVDGNKDGAELVCCKKAKKVVKKRVIKKSLTPCDAIPTAKTYPVQKGEKLAPANIKRCISCDQQYGVIK